MPGFLSNAAQYIAHNPGAVTGIGAGLGAAVGAGREALKAPEERNYVRGALGGAVAGGALGGLVGQGGRAARDTMLLHPELSGAGNIAKATAKRIGTDISNNVQRQFHGLTGYGGGDKAYLNRIGVSGHEAAANQARLMNLRTEDEAGAMWNRAMAQHAKQTAAGDTFGAAQTHLDALKKQHEMEEALRHGTKALHQEGEFGQHYMDLGMTSVPGAVKAMATNPREASKAIWNQMRSGMQGGGLGAAVGALGVGAPAMLAARDLSKGDESSTGGMTVGQKAIRHGASIGSGLLFAGLPIGAQLVAGNLVDAGAVRAGHMAGPAPTEPGKAPPRVIAPRAY